MDLKQLNNKQLLRMFREQLISNQNKDIDFISELKLRGMERDMNELIFVYKKLRELGK